MLSSPTGNTNKSPPITEYAITGRDREESGKDEISSRSNSVSNVANPILSKTEQPQTLKEIFDKATNWKKLNPDINSVSNESDIAALAEKLGISSEALGKAKTEGKVDEVLGKRLAQMENVYANLSKEGINETQIRVIDKVVLELLNSKESHITEHKKTSTMNPIVLAYSITKYNEDIILHMPSKTDEKGELTEIGALKKCKMQINLITGEKSGRLALVEKREFVAAPEDYQRVEKRMNNEKRFAVLTKGMPGVIQPKRVEEIKLRKQENVDKGEKVSITYEFMPGSIMDVYEKPIVGRLDHFCQCAEGIYHLHANGIMHRDIKPENIRFDPSDEQAKISDWDSCLLKGDKEISELRQSPYDVSVGTEGFLPPEQTNDSRKEAAIAAAKVPGHLIDGAPHGATDDEILFELGLKWDVFSFGKTIIETVYLLDSQSSDFWFDTVKIIDASGKTIDTNIHELLDENKSKFPEFNSLNHLLSRMIHEDPWERPSMEEVKTWLPLIRSVIGDKVTTVFPDE